MKRSRINQVIRETEELLAAHQIFLPPFFGWTPGEWAEKGPECSCTGPQRRNSWTGSMK
ncbi:MAG: D-lyxose/D-mannose family sugar isomerase [Acetatifactor sp.]|nr:D-lyxose/D-mannose family sugar isomerase [Acetatifactor sp.]